ncbi:MAG: acyl-CoA thioesterase [Hyphomicrobiales bacterium]
MSDSPAIDLRKRDSFSHWTPVSIRFSDQDPLGHVNNVAIAAYVETGRTMLIEQFRPPGDSGVGFVLANVCIDYRAEVHYPGTVEVGGRILKVGTRSFTSGYGLFAGGLCVATATSVNVFFDTRTRKAVTPPAGIRAKLLAAAGG